MNKAQPAWLQEGVLLGKKYHYQSKNPWVHNTINLSVLALTVAAMVVTFLAAKFFSPWVYIPAGSLVFGLLYFVLTILVVHEGAHGMFVISKNTKRAAFWNRLFGTLASLPIGTDYQKHWELGHHIHHVRPMEFDDPQDCKDHAGKAIFKKLAVWFLIPGYLQWKGLKGAATEYHCPQTDSYGFNPVLALSTLAYWSLVIAAGVFWAWPSVVAATIGTTVVASFNLFKQVMEHGGEVRYEELRPLRSRTSLFKLRHLLMPLNISLHFEHHLNFCVPWYNLHDYHRDLLKIVPAELQSYIFNRDIWEQIMGRKGALPSELKDKYVDDRPVDGVRVDRNDSSPHYPTYVKPTRPSTAPLALS